MQCCRMDADPKASRSAIKGGNMYEELIKQLRGCADAFFCVSDCPKDPDTNCQEQLMKEAADAIEELSNGSEKVVMDYCRKRNLVLITYESFETLKAYYNRGVMPLTEPTKEET